MHALTLQEQSTCSSYSFRLFKDLLFSITLIQKGTAGEQSKNVIKTSETLILAPVKQKFQ